MLRGVEPLIERARAGDSAALQELLQSVAPAIHRFGLRMCKSESDADDVLQDTLLSIATHLPQFEGRSSLSSWVFALTRSACTRRRRGLKNQPHASVEHVGELRDLEPTPEQSVSDRELSDALNAALGRLPDDHREVILLRDVEGLSAAEAAAALGISVEALKSRLHRARAALRDALRPVLEPVMPPASPDCPDVLSLWSRKLEGDLSPKDCSEMEQHVLGCVSCGAACNALKHALWACQQSATPTVRPEVQARVKAALHMLAAAGPTYDRK
jgi:RNA polymerase sigma-70 factor (ECF subfamily)